MRRRPIAFGLDGTLAVSKSAISDVMADRLKALLSFDEVCVISGGKLDQFQMQLIDRLDVSPNANVPAPHHADDGARCLRFDVRDLDWVLRYADDLSPRKRAEIVEVLYYGRQGTGHLETEHFGNIVEDRATRSPFPPWARRHLWRNNCGIPTGSRRGLCVTTPPNGSLTWRCTSVGTHP